VNDFQLSVTIHVKLIMPFYFHLIMLYLWNLTPNGRLVDRLPYFYEWVDGVHD